MYHNVADLPGFGTLSISAMEKQLAWAQDNSRIVTLDDYLRHVEAGGDTRRIMTVTFDDAYMSFAEKAVPVLEHYRIPATLFVPVGHVGGTNTWDAARTDLRLGILDWPAIQDIAKHPLVTIGSHGITHRSLRRLAVADVSDEIVRSKTILEDRLGICICHFSFPYGQMCDIPNGASQILADAGYVSACSTRYGRRNRPSDRYSLRRLEICPADGLSGFIRKCSHRDYFLQAKQYIKDRIRR